MVPEGALPLLTVSVWSGKAREIWRFSTLLAAFTPDFTDTGAAVSVLNGVLASRTVVAPLQVPAPVPGVHAVGHEVTVT